MASASSEPRTVLGRVDRAGRLIAADDALAILQREAGADIGDMLALPQIAAVARLALKLNIAVERAAIAASNDQDFDLWVRATPDGDEVALSLENWLARPAPGPRLATLNLAPQSGAEAEPGRHEWCADSELRITSLSADLARALGVDSAQAAGLPLTRVVQLVEAADGDMPLISALAARRDFSGQSARSRSNPDIQLRLEGAVVTGEDGRFEGFTGQARLIAEQAAGVGGRRSGDSADQALDDVLRSPLDRIIAEAEQIVGRADGPLRSDYANYGNDIAAAARHLLSVVGAMGDDPEYGLGQVDFGALAAEAVMLVEPAAEEAQVRVELEESAALQAVGEERAVIQVLVNLIGNAIRHSPPDGLVSLILGHDDNRAWVTVADQGKGIDVADQQRIFERFERADEAPGGTGLGLAIARRLARSMGGEVTVESAVGRGARFTLVLPIQ